MAEGDAQNQLGADVVLEFSKSISSIQNFGDEMAELDSRFGTIEQRVDSLRNSLSTLGSETANRRNGQGLRKSVENEINDIVNANGVTLTKVGNAPFKVKQQTVKNIFAKIDKELNREIARAIGDINLKIDGNYLSGNIPLSESEFDAINTEIARLVKNQVKHLVDSIRQQGDSMISEDDLRGMNMSIGRQTVKDILHTVKQKLLPAITNPELPTDQVLKFTKRDMQSLMTKIKAKVKESISFDFEGKLTPDNEVDKELSKTTNKIDNIVEDYVKNIRTGLNDFDSSKQQVPVKNLTKSLRKYIAKDLGESVEDFEKEIKTMSVGEASTYELKRQFSALENDLTRKFRNGISEEIKQMREQINNVEISYSPKLKHHLITQINKLNNQVVKKIREQIDEQFRHMRAEIDTINTSPKSINRSGKVRKMSDMVTRDEGGDYVRRDSQRSSSGGSSQRRERPDGFGSDRFAQRDAYMNSFGLEGAITNTFRHIIAGGMVGAPMMAMYDAADTFVESQKELQKIRQNFMLKDEYKTNGETDFGKVEQAIDELKPMIKDVSNLYGTGYKENSQVAAIASRLTSSSKEARQFTEYANSIYRLDGEGDLVETIAPGLEAIMGQFGKSVWEMNEAVKAFGVSTNVTKATTDEIMAGLSRSGSALNANGFSITDSVAAMSIGVQETGLQGRQIGNMYKTVMQRLGRSSTLDMLEDFGIDTTYKDDRGLERIKEGEDLFTQVAELLHNADDTTKNKVYQQLAGGYQFSKFMAVLEKFVEVSDDPANFHNQVEEAEEMNREQMLKLQANANTALPANLDRAKTSMNLAIVSVFEEFSPAINNAAMMLEDFGDNLQEASSSIANLIELLGYAAVGFGAQYGVRKLGQYGGFQGYLDTERTHSKLLGERDLKGRMTSSGLLSQVAAMEGVTGLIGERDYFGQRRLVESMRDKNSLGSHVDRLANYDEQDMTKLRSYVTGSGMPIEGFADLFSAMDEMERQRTKKSLTFDDKFNNASKNFRDLQANPSSQRIFASEFAEEFSNTLQNREGLENSDPEDRRKNRNLISALGEMDDMDLRDFQSYLDDINSTSGRTVNSIAEMSEEMDNFRQRQSEMRLESRRTSDQFRDMSDALTEVFESEGETRRDRRRRNMRSFIDDFPNRTRAGARTGGKLMRGAGKFGVQALGLAAAGSAISTVVEESLMSEATKKVKVAQTQIDQIQQAQNIEESKEDGNFLAVGAGVLTSMVRSFGDLFSSGDTKAGYGELLGDLYKKNASGMTWDEYRKSRGVDDKLREANEEKFIKEYEDQAESQQSLNLLREQADAKRKAKEEELFEQGAYSGLTVPQIQEGIKKELQGLQIKQGAEEYGRTMMGVDPLSDQYTNMKDSHFQERIATYQKGIDDWKDAIKRQEQEQQYLLDTGQAYETDEEGNRKKTKRFRNSENEITRLQAMEQDMNALRNEIKKLQIQREQFKAQQDINRTQRDYQMRMADMSISRAEDSVDMNRNTLSYVQEQERSLNREQSYAHGDVIGAQIDLEQARSRGAPHSVIEMYKKELQRTKQNLQDVELSLKELKLQKDDVYIAQNLDPALKQNELEYLQDKVALGDRANNSPQARALEKSYLKKNKEDIESTITKLKDMRDTEYAVGDEGYEDINKQIRDLQKQSLKVQLDMLDTMKNEGASFNVPDGVRVMTRFDKMMSEGTHSAYNVSAGDTTVNVVLPNVDKNTSSNDMQRMAEDVGKGVTSGRMNSLREMMRANPNGYRSI